MFLPELGWWWFMVLTGLALSMAHVTTCYGLPVMLVPDHCLRLMVFPGLVAHVTILDPALLLMVLPALDLCLMLLPGPGGRLTSTWPGLVAHGFYMPWTCLPTSLACLEDHISTWLGLAGRVTIWPCPVVIHLPGWHGGSYYYLAWAKVSCCVTWSSWRSEGRSWLCCWQSPDPPLLPLPPRKSRCSWRMIK